MRRSRLRMLAAGTALGLVLGALPIGGPDLGPVPAFAKCCFTAATLVTMADGSRRPIAGLVAGDLVMSRTGGANPVVALVRVPLAGRRLHAINGGAAFFTAEHPFLTPAGWKALDPAAAAGEVPGLRVGRLAVGDVLLAAAPGMGTCGNLALAPGLALRPVPLTRLESVPGPAGMEVFNLILGGDHSFIAAGFVVHNKGGDGGAGGGGDGGGGSSGGESGDDGGESGDDGSESGDDGSESGDDGSESGDDGSEGGEAGFSGSAEPEGDDLSPEQERGIISKGWE